MRKILIVGAGQSGLHLGHTLLDHGYDVTVITAATSRELRGGLPAVTEFSLPVALECERQRSLDFWSREAPRIEGVRLDLYPPGQKPMVISGGFRGYGAGYGSAVDRRIKMADWLEYFEDRGGKVVIHGVTISDLDYFSRMFDLVVVAVGGGPLADFFAPDRGRSGGHERVITQVLVDEVAPSGDGPGIIEAVSAREGRVVLTPILTQGGPAYSLSVMGTPGQDTDGSHLRPDRDQPPNPVAITSWIQSVLEHHNFGELAARVRHACPIDERSGLVTHMRPQVRIPVDTLPSGGMVLGLADVVVETDPLCGQGWNNSTLCAEAYAASIIAHGGRPFTAETMRAMFETFWSANTQDPIHPFQGVGQASAHLSHLLHHMWEGPLPEHLQYVLQTATTHQAVADAFIGPLADPRDYAWLHDPATTHAHLSQIAVLH